MRCRNTVYFSRILHVAVSFVDSRQRQFRHGIFLQCILCQLIDGIIIPCSGCQSQYQHTAVPLQFGKSFRQFCGIRRTSAALPQIRQDIQLKTGIFMSVQFSHLIPVCCRRIVSKLSVRPRQLHLCFGAGLFRCRPNTPEPPKISLAVETQNTGMGNGLCQTPKCFSNLVFRSELKVLPRLAHITVAEILSQHHSSLRISIVLQFLEFLISAINGFRIHRMKDCLSEFPVFRTDIYNHPFFLILLGLCFLAYHTSPRGNSVNSHKKPSSVLSERWKRAKKYRHYIDGYQCLPCSIISSADHVSTILGRSVRYNSSTDTPRTLLIAM